MKGRMMKKRFTESQKISLLQEAASGASIKTLCAKHNISESTFYNWKTTYAGMDVSDARRLKSLEDENLRLKRLVADLSVQNQILKEVNAKKW